MSVDQATSSCINQRTSAFEHQSDLDTHAGNSDDGEEDRYASVVAQFVNVSGGNCTKPPEDWGNEPIERRDEQPKPLIPDST